VADWTIQRQAVSGPLRGGGGRSLVPARDTPAQCCRAPLWRCRPIPALFVWGTALGVASAASTAFDLNPRTSRLDDASDLAFTGAAFVGKASEEADAVIPSAGGKTPCVSGGCAAGIEGPDAAAGSGRSVCTVEVAASVSSRDTMSARRGSTSMPGPRALLPAVSSSLGWTTSKKKPRPRKTTTVAIATKPKETRESRVATLGSGALVRSVGGSASVPGVLAGRGPAFWGTLRGMSCRISSLNNCFPRIRRCTSR
jgi:hypothetical protein